MSEALAVYDSFAAAMERLKAARPEHFAFEISETFFSDFPLSEALMKQGMMRSFVHKAGEMGYRVEITDSPGGRYLYDLRMRAVKPAEPVIVPPERLEEGAIDV